MKKEISKLKFPAAVIKKTNKKHDTTVAQGKVTWWRLQSGEQV